MKAKDLIAQLSALNPEAIIEIYCPDAATYLPVAGVVHNATTLETQLYADDMPAQVRTVIWNERGIVLHRCDSEEEAEELIEAHGYEFLSRHYGDDGTCNIAVMDL